MKRFLGCVALVAFAGCSFAQGQNFLGNLAKSDCATPAAQQAFVNNLQLPLGVTPANALFAVGQLCIGFGYPPMVAIAPNAVVVSTPQSQTVIVPSTVK